jgi:hypothetical protein
MSRVFRKTALGVGILTKPNSGLTSVERALLNMIDGKKTASDLRKRLASFGNINQLLRELFEDKLIELEPSYAQQFASNQNDIAKENAALGMGFGTTTTATIGRGANLPKAMRDLRESLPPISASDTTNASFNARSETRAPLKIDAFSEEAPMPAYSAVALENARAHAKRYVFDAIGSSGTALCLAIERAPDTKELLHFFQAASATLRDLKGDAMRIDFDRRLQDILTEDLRFDR